MFHNFNEGFVILIELLSFFTQLLTDIFRSNKDTFKILPFLLDNQPNINNFTNSIESLFPMTNLLDKSSDISRRSDSLQVCLLIFQNQFNLVSILQLVATTLLMHSQFKLFCLPSLFNFHDFFFVFVFLVSFIDDFTNLFRVVLQVESENLFKGESFNVTFHLSTCFFHQLIPMSICDSTTLKLLDKRNGILEISDSLRQFLENAVVFILSI